MTLYRISTHAIVITVSILSYLSNSHSLSSTTAPVNCSTLEFCTECNEKNKQANCIWRQSKCHTLDQSELPVPPRSIVCPPEVRKYRPMSGPLTGGTGIFVTFYFEIGDNDINKISIFVGNRKCKIVFTHWFDVVCEIEKTLPDSDKNIQGPVKLTVEVKDWENFEFGYYIHGKAQAWSPFRFAQPEVYGIYPSHGPLAGITYVMVYGRNLDISTGAHIAFGSYECDRIFVRESMVICRTSPVVSNNTNIDPLPINVSIDSWQKILFDNDPSPMSHDDREEQNFSERELTNDPNRNWNFKYFAQKINLFLTGTLRLGLGRTFRYLPIPEVEKPINLVTVDSGGTSLQFKGRYLGSSAFPVMGIYVPGNYKPEVKMLCTAHSEETVLDCPLESSEKNPAIRKLFNKELRYVLMFDLFENASNFTLQVLPDPGFNDSVKVLPGKERVVEFTGWNLNPSLPYRIFLNSTIRCHVQSRIDEQERHLWCQVNLPPVVMSKYTDSNLEVNISVGSALNFRPGNARFIGDPKARTNGKLPWLLFPVGGAIVIGFLLYKRYRAVKKHPPETVFESAKWQDALDHHLGSGNYGTVFKAVHVSPSTEPEMGETNQVEVAVKVQNRDRGVFYEFIGEAQVMLEFNHPNVMYLVGVTFHENRKPAIVLPFMDGLDLKSFVISEELKVKDLLCFGLQIANGMIYLSDQNIIHRDLALRNCMIQRDNPSLVRVADFGLTRVTTQNYYQRSRNGLPFLWMAPEALKRFRFSIKSDAYSYGITLWELMTRGKTPFEFFTADELIEYLEGGHRLAMPDDCPDLIYTIMGKCWMHDPDDRPTFKEIYDELGRAIDGIDNLENPKAHRYENSFFARYSRNREFIFDYRQQQTRDILNQAEEAILCYKIGTGFDPSRELREEYDTSGSGILATDYSRIMANNEHPSEYLLSCDSPDNRITTPDTQQTSQRASSLLNHI